MKKSTSRRAVLIALAVFAILFLSIRSAQSEQAKNQQTEQADPKDIVSKGVAIGNNAFPIVDISLDTDKKKSTIQPITDKKICSLAVVDCQSEQADLKHLLSGTNFQGHEQAILQASVKYNVPVGLILGVANAESTLGRHCKWNNCFGIMAKKRVLKKYKTLDDGILDFARLIRTKYMNKGLITPEQIAPRYVGHLAPWWLKNVRKYYSQ